MKIAVIGTGYVGLVSGACFAETGNEVLCVDADEAKIARLAKGEVPFYEPGLPELVERNVREGRLSFTSDTSEAVRGARISFICVGTPSSRDGSADLTQVLRVAEAVAATDTKAILVVKSTVPVGTCDAVKRKVREHGAAHIEVVSNPEFLREGSAVQDCLMPDRIVVGTESPGKVADLFRQLYEPFVRTGHPILVMDIRSAEMTKYASNAFLAMRISYINEMSMICDAVGADVTRVREGVGSDSRIGMQYLFPSIGFGGSCFPKDVRALIALAEKSDVEPHLMRATLEINETQKRRFAERVVAHFGGISKAKGRSVAIWGLSFKAKTDDIRESASLSVIDVLLKAGVCVKVFDPVAMQNAKAVYGAKIAYAESAYEAIEGAHALCVLTEWNQFRHPDFSRVKELLAEPVIFDGRNLFNPGIMKTLGFAYHSIGRPS